MRKNMFDRLLEKGLTREREDLAKNVAERLEGYEIPDSVTASTLTCEGNPHPIDIYMPKNDEPSSAIVDIHGGGLVLGSNLQNKQYCVHMAERGYIVLAIDYSLVPEVTAFVQLEEIARAMDAAGEWLKSCAKWNGNLYGIGDSAGAYLLLYTCVLAARPEIAEAMGVSGTNTRFNAVAFQNGMFYSTRRDKIGMLASQFYGKGYAKQPYAKYLDTEREDIVTAIPPFYMMTTVNDYLRHYSNDYAKSVRKYRSDFVFMDYDYETLGHADSATRPFMPESVLVNDDICEFFASIEQGIR